MMIESGHTFAHATTAELCDLIASLESKLEQ